MRRPVRRPRGQWAAQGRPSKARGQWAWATASPGHPTPPTAPRLGASRHPAPCGLSPPPQAGGAPGSGEVEAHLCPGPGAWPASGDRPVPEDHKAAAPGYWWGWVRSGAWTLGAQTPSPCLGTSRAKVKVREHRWTVAPGGAGGGGLGRGPVFVLCGVGCGGDGEAAAPPYPPPAGVSAVGLLGASQVGRQGRGLWGGDQRAWSSPCRPIGWGGQGPSQVLEEGP